MSKITGKDYLNVELYYEQESWIRQLPEEYRKRSEMSAFDRAFLCGLIKKYRPRKMVEAGVAAGTTSAVILNCLGSLELETVCYSIDICENYYRDSSRKSGYVVDEVKDRIKNCDKINHKMLLGKSFPERLEEIGGEIDFLILDTMHRLPGDLLDFIAAYPFLSEHAIVVLHDIGLNLLNQNDFYMAPKVVFDTVSADKYLMADVDQLHGLPNIGAFRITKATRDNIGDLFSCMTYSWHYLPDLKLMRAYRRIVEQYYEDRFLSYFDRAWILQREMAENTVLKKKLLKKAWNEYEHILFYGAGKVGSIFYYFARENALKIDGVVVSDLSKVNEFEKSIFDDVPMYEWRDRPYNPDECGILITVGARYHDEIFDIVTREGYKVIG